MTDFLSSLNRDQRAAATATEGYVRVIAGAGSGKTRALTCRYAYLVKAAGIHPSNVLCVTFTNKAAGEMKRRVRSLVGDGYDTSLITTYHGFCVRVLREDIHRLFYPKNFVILDEQAQRRILSEIYAEMEIKLDRATFESILDTVHRLKSNEEYVPALVNGDAASITPPPASPVRPLTALEITVVRRYLEKQRKAFGLDFDDLVSFARSSKSGRTGSITSRSTSFRTPPAASCGFCACSRPSIGTFSSSATRTRTSMSGAARTSRSSWTSTSFSRGPKRSS